MPPEPYPSLEDWELQTIERWASNPVKGLPSKPGNRPRRPSATNQLPATVDRQLTFYGHPRRPGRRLRHRSRRGAGPGSPDGQIVPGPSTSPSTPSNWPPGPVYPIGAVLCDGWTSTTNRARPHRRAALSEERLDDRRMAAQATDLAPRRVSRIKRLAQNDGDGARDPNAPPSEKRRSRGGSKMRGLAARLRAMLATGLLCVATSGGACSGGTVAADDGLLRAVLEVVQEGVRDQIGPLRGRFLDRSRHQAREHRPARRCSRDVVPGWRSPPGDGDTISLITATSTSGVALKGTSRPFDIRPRWTTVVTVNLPGASVDAGMPSGTIDVRGTIVPVALEAPSIAFLMVSPLEVAVGSPIEVAVTASDPEVD